MSSETLLRTSSSSFLSHLVVDTPSAGGRLTPSFFNSIFNDGMNPFDESFTLTTNNSAPLDFNFSGTSNSNSTAGKIKPSPLCNDKIAIMLPTIETGKTPDGELLRRRPMSPLSPPISPDKPDTVVRSPNTRSPSPFSYPDPFLSTPSPSASPITSPDEATPVIKQEDASPPSMSEKPRRRTISAGEKPKVTATAEKSAAEPEKKSRAKSAHQIIVVQKQSDETPAAKPAAGRKRKISAEPKQEEGDDDDEDVDGSSNKRARFLERNRIAASKCRKKKKVMNQRLEEKSRLLHQHNRYLNQLVSSLKSDVLRLKQCLLIHHDCDDDPIKRYLQYEAGKVFENKADKVVTPILKSESKASPQLLDELEKDRINDLNEKWVARSRDLNAEFHSFQEVESAALGRLGKGSELSYDEELKMLFGDEMS